MDENTTKKKGVLQLALQLNVWVANDTCNSLYLYIVSANGQIAWVAKLQLIAIPIQLNQNNSFLITL